jgi:hypothetical protein
MSEAKHTDDAGDMTRYHGRITRDRILGLWRVTPAQVDTRLFFSRDAGVRYLANGYSHARQPVRHEGKDSEGKEGV